MLLSIIIPVYNNYDNFRETLKSLSKQTIIEKNNVEVLVIDDGSTESQKMWMFEKLKNKLRFFTIEHGGAPVARNFGYKICKGDFVFFLDSDVVFLDNQALEIMLNKLRENPNKGYVYSGFKFGFKTFNSFEFDADKLRQDNYISTMSLVRREALEEIKNNGPWDETLTKFQDWDLWLSLLNKNIDGLRINKILWQAKPKGTMSAWLPSFVYSLPLIKKLPFLKKIEEKKQIVKNKNGI